MRTSAARREPFVERADRGFRAFQRCEDGGDRTLSPAAHLSVTDLVVALPPAPLAAMLADEGYLPRGLPLIKRVLALPGQTVCRTGVFVTVDGIVMGSAREKDRNGRKLPEWQGCRVVAPEHVFLMNWDEPSSFDGRYFGMLPISAVLGRAEPIWTSEED